MKQLRKISFYGVLTIFNSLLLLVFAYLFFTRPMGNSSFILTDQSGRAQIEMFASDEGGNILIRDANGIDRVHILGGETAAVMLKNKNGELVGTIFTGHDESGTIGLGDAGGNVATLMKGGSDPSIGFFRGTAYPSLSMGISDNIPHVLFYSPTKEQLVLHGGSTNSLLFIDQNGGVPLALTKDGLQKPNDEVACKFCIPYKINRGNKLISNLD